MRTTAVQSVACGRPSRPAPGRGYVSPTRAAFLLLLFAALALPFALALLAAGACVGIGRPRRLVGRDDQRALHPEGGVIAHRAEQLVGARRELRLSRFDLARPEDRGAAEVGAVLLDVQVVRQRAVVAQHEAHDGRL